MRDAVTARKVTEALTELADAGFIIAYAIDGRSFVQIKDWW